MSHLDSHVKFEDILDNLIQDAKGQSPRVIAGDFDNAKGRSLLEACAQCKPLLERGVYFNRRLDFC